MNCRFAVGAAARLHSTRRHHLVFPSVGEESQTIFFVEKYQNIPRIPHGYPNSLPQHSPLFLGPASHYMSLFGRMCIPHLNTRVGGRVSTSPSMVCRKPPTLVFGTLSQQQTTSATAKGNKLLPLVQVKQSPRAGSAALVQALVQVVDTAGAAGWGRTVTLCRAPAFLLLLIFLVSPTTVGTRATHTRPSSPAGTVVPLIALLTDATTSQAPRRGPGQSVPAHLKAPHSQAQNGHLHRMP